MYKSKHPALNLPQTLIDQIEQVTVHQIDELLQTVIQRANHLQPGHEIILLSLSTNPDRRIVELELIMNSIRSLYQIP